MPLPALMVRVILGIIFIALLAVSSSAVEEMPSKQILILASYNPGLKWTDSISNEIVKQLSIENFDQLFNRNI